MRDSDAVLGAEVILNCLAVGGGERRVVDTKLGKGVVRLVEYEVVRARRRRERIARRVCADSVLAEVPVGIRDDREYVPLVGSARWHGEHLLRSRAKRDLTLAEDRVVGLNRPGEVENRRVAGAVDTGPEQRARRECRQRERHKPAACRVRQERGLPIHERRFKRRFVAVKVGRIPPVPACVLPRTDRLPIRRLRRARVVDVAVRLEPEHAARNVQGRKLSTTSTDHCQIS